MKSIKSIDQMKPSEYPYVVMVDPRLVRTLTVDERSPDDIKMITGAVNLPNFSVWSLRKVVIWYGFQKPEDKEWFLSLFPKSDNILKYTQGVATHLWSGDPLNLELNAIKTLH